MADTGKEWTIMVYMAGDNNLSEDMITALNELDAGVSTATRGTGEEQIDFAESKVNFFVEYDPSHPTAKTRRFIFGNKLTAPRNASGNLEPSAVFANQSSDKVEESIKKFVIDGIKKYPAKRYALIISGHSDAFQGRTLLLDENPPGTTTLKNLRCKIKEALNDSSVTSLDLLGFDSCVMNTLEVIYEFCDVTKYWVGSQGSIPNYTWDYRGIGGKLAEKKSEFEPRDVIKVIVEQTGNFNKRYAFNGRSIDISGFDMKFFNSADAIQTLNNLFDLLKTTLLLPFFVLLLDEHENKDNFNENYDFTRFPLLKLLILVHWKCQNTMHNQSVDLLDFCECLADALQQFITETKSMVVSTDALSEETNSLIEFADNLTNICNAVTTNLNNSYLKGISIGADQRFVNGVSMFLPWSFMAYQMSRENYHKLDFIKNNSSGKKWDEFINLFTFLSQRPRPHFNMVVLEPVIKILEQSGLEILSNTDSTNKETSLDLINILFSNLFEGSGGVKDDPKRTRGLDDDYSYYFRRMKNIRSDKADLDSGRSFGIL